MSLPFPMNFIPPPKVEQSDAEFDELYGESDSEDEDPNTFKIRDALEKPTRHEMSIRDLHDLIHGGGIDMDPAYQRDVVWPESKQIALIDSIFRNYYIPPIVFAVHHVEGEPEDVMERVCVDGKQRLTSIQKFCDGQIPHRDVKTKKAFWFTLPESSRGVRTELPEAAKDLFCEKQITCMEYHGLTPGAERDIFQRVQMGMTLTGAEKLQAISSPWAEWISALDSKHVAVDGGLSAVLEWDTKRGRDFQNIAYFVCCCDGLPDTETIPTAQKMEKWLSRVDSPPERFKSDVEEVLKDFWNIASNSRLNSALKSIGSRLAPAEFIYIGVLLFVLRKEPIENRAAAIGHLRKTIRSQYQDIRLNGTVCKSLWAIIRDLRDNTTKTLSRTNGDTKVRKRRKTDMDDEDDEYRPAPVSILGKSTQTRSRQKKRGAY
ncbi:hypothetical protein FPV67DRAFT_419036 [Lyophyllum atratum]|nr:hypothetical protein FPV67DRAFT_419036 [Lyophyllum atratum]